MSWLRSQKHSVARRKAAKKIKLRHLPVPSAEPFHSGPWRLWDNLREYTGRRYVLTTPIGWPASTQVWPVERASWNHHALGILGLLWVKRGNWRCELR